jgi:hypothetical protein
MSSRRRRPGTPRTERKIPPNIAWYLRKQISRFPDRQFQHPVGGGNRTLDPMLAAQLAKRDGFA